MQKREAAELVFEQGIVDPPCRLPARGDAGPHGYGIPGTRPDLEVVRRWGL